MLPVYFLYLCSDGLSHSAKRLSESNRLDLLRNITELLGRTFPSQFVFPVLGHEDVQNNDYKDYKSFLMSLGNIWRQWLPLEALQTFEKGKHRCGGYDRRVFCWTRTAKEMIERRVVVLVVVFFNSIPSGDRDLVSIT